MNDIEDAVTEKDLSVNSRGQRSRLTGDLSCFRHHLESVQTGRKHPKICVVCGENTYSVCHVCDKSMHFFPTKGSCAGRNCFLDFHDDNFFGLAYEDRKILKKSKKDWSMPTQAKRKSNQRHIRNLRARMEEND